MRKEDILDVIDRFEKSSCTELELTDDRFSLKLRRKSLQSQGLQGSVLETKDLSEVSCVGKDKNDSHKVRAPLVGVFYASPSPEAESFVKVGDLVKKGDTLCLMEAMKMMNELKSPVDGVVKAIYGRNGELAEYDEILFEVEEC